MWKVLRASGTPPFLVQLLEDLHPGTKSCVRADWQLSEPFDTTSGIRQGCVLAPALFCIAMDWILNRCAEFMGVTVGSTCFTDQAYADDGVLFTVCLSKWPEILTTFDVAAETMGLHTSWQKTKIRNIGHGTLPSSVYMQASGQTVEAVDQFVYLDSSVNSDGRSTHEIHRRIGMASGIMGRLSSVWQQSRLSLATKLRVYNSLVLSVLLYGCDTWTILKSDERKLEAFHKSC